jgi:hypothetical protein
MAIPEYIKTINKRYITGISREHSCRGDLQSLMEGMLRNVLVTNEPARIACGAGLVPAGKPHWDGATMIFRSLISLICGTGGVSTGI